MTTCEPYLRVNQKLFEQLLIVFRAMVTRSIVLMLSRGHLAAGATTQAASLSCQVSTEEYDLSALDNTGICLCQISAQSMSYAASDPSTNVEQVVQPFRSQADN